MVAVTMRPSLMTTRTSMSPWGESPWPEKLPSRHRAAGMAGALGSDGGAGVGSGGGMGIGATTVPAASAAGEGGLRGAATVDAGLAMLAMAVSVVVDAGACRVLRTEPDDGRPCAVAAATAFVAGASMRGCAAGKDGAISAGGGSMAGAWCVLAAGLRPFACVSNCRAASRVRQ